MKLGKDVDRDIDRLFKTNKKKLKISRKEQRLKKEHDECCNHFEGSSKKADSPSLGASLKNARRGGISEPV
jgi:hypothetical protein